MKNYLPILLYCGSLVLSHTAFAGPINTELKASASIAPKCDVSTTTMNFGEITPGLPSSTATVSFTMRCTNATSYQYYIGNEQWGTDCPFLIGTNYGDKIGFGVKDLQTNDYTANNFTGTGGAAIGNLVSGIGTGLVQTFNFKGVIQPPQRDGYGRTFDDCVTASGSGIGYKSPGVNFNPYVNPDNYTANMVFGVIY